MTVAEKLTQAAENVPKVYDAGKKAEYNAFWDAYLSDIKQSQDMFAGAGWNNDTFYPTKDLVFVGNSQRAFFGNAVTNLKERLEQLGVKLDFSGALSVNVMFSEAKTTHLPELDFSSCTAHSNMFYYNTALVSIDRIKFAEGVAVTNNFYQCKNLTHVIFGGVIAVDGLDLHWSKGLDRESIISIINALSQNTSGLSVTLSKDAVNTAFETSADSADGSESDEWQTLIGTKENWEIILS